MKLIRKSKNPKVGSQASSGRTRSDRGASARQPRTVYYRSTSKRNIDTRQAPSKTKSADTPKRASALSRLLQRFFSGGGVVRSLPGLIVPAVIVAMLIFATTLSNNVVIETTKDQYNYRSTQEYSNAAGRLVSETGLLQSKLLFRSERFESAFQAEFPEISQATALLPLGGRDLTLQIDTVQPLAKIQSADTRAKVIGDNGSLIVLPEHTSETQILTPIILDSAYSRSLQQGDQVLSRSEIDILQLMSQETASGALTEAGIDKIERVQLSISSGELYIYFSGVPYYAKLSSFSQVRQQVGGVVATILDLAQSGEPPLEYVDVRVPGRVFVK